MTGDCPGFSRPDGARPLRRHFRQGRARNGLRLAGFTAASGRRNGPAETPSTPAAELFAPPVKVWYPSLEPTMLRLATQVRWWQLGTDEDTSFVGSTDLPAKIADVKGALDRLGQDVCVGIGWDWRAALPAAAKPPWQFLTLSAQPPLEAAELARQLDAPRAAGTVRWVVLRAFPAEGHTPQARVEDLVRRMLAAKMRGADGIFCPDPFDAQCGLMEPDGSPGELLLPWRTTALMLGGAKVLGAAELPGGSASAVFTRRGEAVLVLWNPRPQDETLYLGPNLPPGRSVGPRDAARRARRRPGGPRGAVAHLCSSAPASRWSAGNWPSPWPMGRSQAIPMQPQDNSFSLKNTFAEAVNVKVKLTAPAGWTGGAEGVFAAPVRRRREPAGLPHHASHRCPERPAGAEAGIDIRAGRSLPPPPPAADRRGPGRRGPCGQRPPERPRRVGGATDDGKSRASSRSISVADSMPPTAAASQPWSSAWPAARTFRSIVCPRAPSCWARRYGCVPKRWTVPGC